MIICVFFQINAFVGKQSRGSYPPMPVAVAVIDDDDDFQPGVGRGTFFTPRVRLSNPRPTQRRPSIPLPRHPIHTAFNLERGGFLDSDNVPMVFKSFSGEEFPSMVRVFL